MRSAYGFARNAHTGQKRKVGGGDYFDAHVEQVAQMVADAGGSPEQVAAALLHDVVEDCGVSLDHLRFRFGDTVAGMVDHVSEQDKSLAYRVRKSAYVERLRNAPAGTMLVALADKLHNATDTMRQGASALSHFPSFFWYYDALVEVFSDADLTPAERDLFDTLLDVLGNVRANAA